jgi:O-antigen/teichoic acid export membrane protein
MLVAAVLAQLSFQLPLWLLGWFGNSHEVALYGAGAQLFMALNLMFGVTAIGAMPSIIRLHARGERERLARFARGAALVSALPVAVSVAALVWFGPDLTSLIFGPDYRESGTVALLLCFGLLFQTLFGLNATLLVMTGSQLSSSLVLLGGTLSLLVLTWVLYFEAGVTGAALAAASVLALQNAALGMLVKRRLGFVPCAWIR